MPWSNQSGGGGGPWSGGGGGSGGGGNNNGGGRGPWGGGPPGSGPTPPDLEAILRRGQDRLRNVLPGGNGKGIGGRGIAFIIAGLIIAWVLTGVYRVQPEEVGVNLVFGKFVSISPPGLNYNYPYPIGSVLKPKVTIANSFTVGTTDNSSTNGEPDESLMLTGDENIVDINFTVQWQIDPARPQDFLFNIEDQEGTVRAVAESAVREIIGQRDLQPILTSDRLAIQDEVQKLMQSTLNGYKAGVLINSVQLQNVDPPQQVVASFRDVIAASVDSQRMQNEAQTYASRVVPEARGQAARITQAAEAYRDQTVAEARGQASNFSQVEQQYKKAPVVTRERMYLEAMENVFGGANKVILDSNGGRGVLPYLPLGQLKALPPPPASTSSSDQGQTDNSQSGQQGSAQ